MIWERRTSQNYDRKNSLKVIKRYKEIYESIFWVDGMHNDKNKFDHNKDKWRAKGINDDV